MSNIDKLQFYFGFSFVRYAFVVGLLIALCSSLLGVTLVLKRFSFIGDGLSHVAFGAMSLSATLPVMIKRAALSWTGSNKLSPDMQKVVKWFTNLNDMYIVLPVTLICAILLLRSGQNTKIKGDAAVAMVSVGSLALGYLLMNRFPSGSNTSGDVCSTLFGSTSILTLKREDVNMCIIMAIVVILTYILFYNKIFAVTFDENFIKATGVRANAYNLLIAVVTAMIIVLAMNLVGSLLISALIIFPALAAMRVFKSFRSVIVCSAVISIVCAAFGIISSILFSTPVGSTIVVADLAVFLLFSLISVFIGRSKA
ncbi:metal ABC transporter permease [uncultured Ruminococcus sp.]|uniref:metal ABC transporter permease n=1 Tax=uncultured Ruminococcus sp. TaxID=165186 RepID=UPI002634DEB1|nr:metal ABC transporter permease [uncultured Ruminococcus sp.]